MLFLLGFLFTVTYVQAYGPGWYIGGWGIPGRHVYMNYYPWTMPCGGWCSNQWNGYAPYAYGYGGGFGPMYGVYAYSGSPYDYGLGYGYTTPTYGYVYGNDRNTKHVYDTYGDDSLRSNNKHTSYDNYRYNTYDSDKYDYRRNKGKYDRIGDKNQRDKYYYDTYGYKDDRTNNKKVRDDFNKYGYITIGNGYDKFGPRKRDSGFDHYYDGKVGYSGPGKYEHYFDRLEADDYGRRDYYDSIWSRPGYGSTLNWY